VKVVGQELTGISLDIDNNLLRLHKVSASRMPFISTMQQTIRTQSEEIDQQREVIIALMFRHLLGHLPGDDYKDQRATDNWKEFWKDAMRHLGVKDDERIMGTNDDSSGNFIFEDDNSDTAGAKGDGGEDLSSDEETSHSEEDPKENDEEPPSPAPSAVATNKQLAKSAFERGKHLYGELSTVIHLEV
jgi:hypothetical protein